MVNSFFYPRSRLKPGDPAGVSERLSANGRDTACERKGGLVQPVSTILAPRYAPRRLTQFMLMLETRTG